MPPLPEQLPFTINLRQINRGVGYIALLLPVGLGLMTVLGGLCFRESISHYYYSRLGGDFFVGSLVFIGLLLLFFYDFKPQEIDGYLEHRWYDLWLVKFAGVCAITIAFVPTAGSGCVYDRTEVARVFLTSAVGSNGFHSPFGQVTGTVSHDFWASFSSLGAPNSVPVVLKLLHVSLAGVMLTILAYFSFFVFTRRNSLSSGIGQRQSKSKAHRNKCYRVLGAAIGLSVAAITVKSACEQWLLTDNQAQQLDFWWDSYRLTFFFEAVALVSFGTSWLIKGRFISMLADPPEE